MKQLVFDIETSGGKLKDLSESQQEYLLREAEKEIDPVIRQQKINDAERLLGLYPFTAKVIVIGMYDVESGKSFVYYLDDEKTRTESESQIIFESFTSEKMMLEKFWEGIKVFDQIITFNGRGFDVPFLMLRSAMLGVRVTRNFMGYRYETKNHVDLLEQLSFYGGFKRFNLDFYCHAFGIESPKSKGVTGMDVQELYEAGKIKEIASYCARDVLATYELYKIWNTYLNPKN